MREILFKAKRIDNGEWVEGYLLFIGDKAYIVCDAETMCMDGENTDLYATEWYEVNKDTICQYTGLTDKNGNKIWENDVVKDNVIFGTVVWDEKNARFMIDDINDGLQEYSDWWHEVEVIGNIFGNPELLEGGGEE